MITDARKESIVEKLLQLSPNRVIEVEDFIDFLLAREETQVDSEEPLLSVAGILSGEPLTSQEIETELY